MESQKVVNEGQGHEDSSGVANESMPGVSDEDESVVDFVPQDLIHTWCGRLKKDVKLVSKKSSSKEPYKFIYEAIEDAKKLRQEIQAYFCELESPGLETSFWVKFILIHTYSCIAKWNEACDQLSEADNEHSLCTLLIDQVLETDDNEVAIELDSITEIKYGYLRVRYMLIYELTRYAILCSERDNQEKALALLTRAEEFYHKQGGKDNLQITSRKWPILIDLDSLNSQSSFEMFVYVLFYLGQAYMIMDQKEKAILYLHMVLRKQLENDTSTITTWSADTVKMAAAVLINVQSFPACKTLLLAATAVLSNGSEEEKSTDEFKQTWADLGRGWMKLGLEVLELSCDRLKDLEEQTRKPPKFSDTLTFTYFEKMSLELSLEIDEFDTLLLINSLKFPSLEFTDLEKTEMPIRYARDFEEARAIFLPLQKWFRISKEYYVIDSFAGDYIELVTDYAASFKYLIFFEPDIDRQVKMQKRRIAILEELLNSLSPVAYQDVFHYILKDLADTYEKIYKLKVSKARDKGEALRPKDKKLVKLLSEAVAAQRRNLDNFHFDLNDTTKEFPEAYEKALLGTVLSIGRLLGSISHDHPLHPDAIMFAEEGKSYYEYFLKYLDKHPALKSDFKSLYDGSLDLPELLDKQIERIRHRLTTLNVG